MVYYEFAIFSLLATFIGPQLHSVHGLHVHRSRRTNEPRTFHCKVFPEVGKLTLHKQYRLYTQQSVNIDGSNFLTDIKSTNKYISDLEPALQTYLTKLNEEPAADAIVLKPVPTNYLRSYYYAVKEATSKTALTVCNEHKSGFLPSPRSPSELSDLQYIMEKEGLTETFINTRILNDTGLTSRDGKLLVKFEGAFNLGYVYSKGMLSYQRSSNTVIPKSDSTKIKTLCIFRADLAAAPTDRRQAGARTIESLLRKFETFQSFSRPFVKLVAPGTSSTPTYTNYTLPSHSILDSANLILKRLQLPSSTKIIDSRRLDDFQKLNQFFTLFSSIYRLQRNQLRLGQGSSWGIRKFLKAPKGPERPLYVDINQAGDGKFTGAVSSIQNNSHVVRVYKIDHFITHSPDKRLEDNYLTVSYKNSLVINSYTSQWPTVGMGCSQTQTGEENCNATSILGKANYKCGQDLVKVIQGITAGASAFPSCSLQVDPTYVRLMPLCNGGMAVASAKASTAIRPSCSAPDENQILKVQSGNYRLPGSSDCTYTLVSGTDKGLSDVGLKQLKPKSIDMDVEVEEEDEEIDFSDSPTLMLILLSVALPATILSYSVITGLCIYVGLRNPQRVRYLIDLCCMRRRPQQVQVRPRPLLNTRRLGINRRQNQGVNRAEEEIELQPPQQAQQPPQPQQQPQQQGPMYPPAPIIIVQQPQPGAQEQRRQQPASLGEIGYP